MINFNVQIRDFPFNESSQQKIESWHNGNREYGTNWPVVYLIHNDDTKEAYIGETLNAGRRAAQHWQIQERQRLKTIHIMTDDTFNKSVILDLEAFLIKYISADRKYRLQNGNAGLASFDYYNRSEYEKQFHKIWNSLKELGLVQSGIADIEDSDFFKYSPYKSLTQDQQIVLEKILFFITGFLKQDLEYTLVIRGGAGTGKTILAVFLLKLLSDLMNRTYEKESETESAASDLGEIHSLLAQRKMKIGFVVPQQSLRETLKKVFCTINGMSETMIMTPREAALAGKDEPFDLLVCDEAHRLHRREGLSQFQAFDKTNQELGLAADASELEWLIHSSRMQLLFYDPDQSVRPSDVTQEMFEATVSRQNKYQLSLTSQLRCLGGSDYIQYIRNVLNAQGYVQSSHGYGHGRAVMKEGSLTRPLNLPIPQTDFQDYRLGFYDNLDEMMDEINRLNRECGLSCAVAGYGWKWVTKDHPNDPDLKDIPIGRGYIWNRTYTDWINSARLPNEIGCIHTVQGYDLNYVGVIFGPEIIYVPHSKRIEVIKKKYMDSRGKAVGNDYEALRTYILNIYATLLTRGIHGAFVYVCDPELREFLRKYFSENQ